MKAFHEGKLLAKPLAGGEVDLLALDACQTAASSAIEDLEVGIGRGTDFTLAWNRLSQDSLASSAGASVRAGSSMGARARVGLLSWAWCQVHLHPG